MTPVQPSGESETVLVQLSPAFIRKDPIAVKYLEEYVSAIGAGSVHAR